MQTIASKLRLLALALILAAVPAFGQQQINLATQVRGRLPLANFVQGGTNTILSNATAGTADFTALSIGGCSSASSALIWTTNTGFGCNTSITANTAATATSATTATNANNVQTTSTAAAGSWFPLFVGSSVNGYQAPNLATGLSFVPSTGTLTATTFSGTVTTNANLTGPITSVGNATSIASQTGTGTKFVMDTSPTLAGSPVINTTASVGGTWTAAATWTLPAHTLGGTVSGGANQINNVVIGASTPLAGTFTTLQGTTDIFAGIRATHRSTDRISVTGATTIFTPSLSGSSVGASGALLLVNGYNTAAATNSFLDLVLYITGVAPVVITGGTVNRGAPAARTYSNSGGTLALAMASGTYNVAVSSIEQSD